MRDRADRTRSLLILATNASVATAALLIIVKFGAWLITGSLSILASLVDSLLDVAASIINMVAVRYSLKSPDDDHQFGHGKAESLAGLAQSAFIGGSAFFIIIQTIERFTKPQPIEDVAIGVWIMAFAILATTILLLIQRHVIKHTGSTAIKADLLHYSTDLLTNVSTIIAILLTAKGWHIVDPLFALGIALYVLYSAWNIGFEAVQTLMDRQLPARVRETICDIVLAHPKVLGMHDLRTRKSGQINMIQLHIEFDDQMELLMAHTIAKEVEAKIEKAFPGSDIIIHQDPIGKACKLKTDEPCVDKKIKGKEGR
jgi:ferrous-iron efflux pump FieF